MYRSNCVTVILPYYNRVVQVENSLKSALQQTYRNIQILVVNDGSTEPDDSVRRITDSDDRAYYIRLDRNSGPAAARNAGLDKAKGEYIAFLDSDDLFLPEKIEVQLERMLECDAIISHTSFIQKYGSTEEKIRNGRMSGNVIPLAIGSCHIATPTVMLKRDYILKNSIRFVEKYRYGEDICFWLEVLRKCNLLGIDRPLSVVNSCSNSTSFNPEKSIEGLSNILEYIMRDEQYRGYHQHIAHLCRRYVSLSSQLGKNGVFRNARKERMLNTIRRQGIVKTMYKRLTEFVAERVNGKDSDGIE